MSTSPRRLMITSRSMTPQEQHDLKNVLRDAILFIAGLKVCSAFLYLALYFLVNIYSEGFWSTTLKAMIATLVPLEVINGLLLFLGALEIQPIALKVAALMCLFVAILNTIMGVMGALYFFRIGNQTMHFVIAIIFGLTALSFCSVLCHDLVIIFMLIRLIENLPPPNPANPANSANPSNTSTPYYNNP